MKKQNSEKNKKQKTEDAVNAADMILNKNKIDLHKLKRFQDAFTWKRNMVFESIKKLEEVQRDITRMRVTHPFNISILKELDGFNILSPSFFFSYIIKTNLEGMSSLSKSAALKRRDFVYVKGIGAVRVCKKYCLRSSYNKRMEYLCRYLIRKNVKETTIYDGDMVLRYKGNLSVSPPILVFYVS